jgi:hypothetical protein
MQRGDMVYVTAHQCYGIVDHVGPKTILVRELRWELPEPGGVYPPSVIWFSDLVWCRANEVIEFIPPRPPLRAA